MVWEQRKQRFARDRQTVDWVVIRNRLSHLDARNKRNVGHVLEALQKRIGFRFLPGLSERVIFRELFLSGLTLMDLDQTGRSEEHKSELQSLMRISYAVFCLQKKNNKSHYTIT